MRLPTRSCGFIYGFISLAVEVARRYVSSRPYLLRPPIVHAVDAMLARISLFILIFIAFPVTGLETYRRMKEAEAGFYGKIRRLSLPPLP